MSHTFSLSYLTVPGVTPPEQTYIAARAGYDDVSYRLVNLGVAGEPEIDPLGPQVIRETNAALAETGLGCFDIELFRITRSQDLGQFERAFAAGAELGARHAISSAWTDVRNDRDFLVDSFSELCDLASPYGITVNLEFPAFSRLTTLKEVVEILERSGRRNQGILVDTLYMHFNRAPLFQLETVPGDWLNFLHICDAEDLVYTRDEMIHMARDARLYPGEGAIDFSVIDYLFPDIPCSLELPNEARTSELGHEGHARRCLEAAKEVLGMPLGSAGERSA